MLFGNQKKTTSFFLKKTSLIVFLGIILKGSLVQAVTDYSLLGPLQVRNQNPLYLQFLMPRAEDSSVVPKGHLNLTFTAPYSNLYENPFNISSGTNLILDMEIFRPAFFFRYGFREDWEAGAELPFLEFSGGFLDPFIQGFHDVFNFPNGGRENRRNGAFEYRVESRDGVNYQVDDQPFGLSDITFHLKRHLFKEEKFGKYSPGLAATAYLKIPTGMRSEGLGSGRPDLGFNFSSDKSFWRMGTYLNLGLVILGGQADLDPILRPALVTWMLGAELVAIEKYLNVTFQLNGDSALFTGTGVAQLSHGSLDLVVGLSGRVGDRFFWQFGFTEDPDINGPSIDFTTTFVVGYHWDITPRKNQSSEASH